MDPLIRLSSLFGDTSAFAQARQRPNPPPSPASSPASSPSIPLRRIAALVDDALMALDDGDLETAVARLEEVEDLLPNQ